MGNAYTPSSMQGFIIPDAATYWEEESGQLDAGLAKIGDVPFVGKVAGDPVASDPTNLPEMRLRAAGEQTASEIILVNRRGLPVLDECGVLRRPTKDGNTDDRGRDLPNVPTRFEPLLPPGACTSPHIVTLDDDSVLACWWRSGTGVQVQSRSAAGVISAVTTAHSATGVVDLHPCLAVLPSGAVRLYYWRPDGTDYQVGTRLSRDRGTSWSAGQDALVEALTGATITSVERLRAVYWRGMMLLTAHIVKIDTAGPIYRDRIASWSSSDGGGLLYHVSTQDGTTEEFSGGWQDLVVSDGQCIVARIRWSTVAASAVVAVSRISSARMSLDLAGEESTTAGVVSGTYLALRTGGGAADYLLADSDLACWMDDDGALYLAVRRCDTAAAGPPPGMQACFLLRSAKRGDADSWLTTGNSDVLAGRGQAWYWDEAGNSYPTRFAMTAQRGRTIFACDAVRASTGIIASSIFLGYLGGWQSRTMPSAGQGLQPTRRISWMRPQFAIDSPDAQGWTLTTSGGTETHAVANFREQVSAPLAGEFVRYSRSGALFTPAEGAALEVAWEPTLGTTYLRIYAYDVAPLRYASEVRITTTTVELWDIGAGAKIGATWNRTGSGRIRVRLDQQLRNAECRIYEGNSTDEDRKWTQVAVTAALVDPGAGWVADALEIEFGAVSAGALDEWYAFWGAYCGQHFIGQSTSQRYPGCVTPSGCYSGSGERLSAITGPAEVGDEWTSTQTWQYPPQAILPRVTPSPRSGCRVPIDELNASAVWVQLAFKIGETETFPFNSQYGAIIDRALFGGGELWVYYGAAWHAFGTQGRYGFVADRRGKTMRVNNAGPTLAPVVRRNELHEAFAELVSGGGPTSNYQMRVARNSPGAIDTSAGASFPLTMAVDQSLVGAPAQPTVRVYPTRILMLEDLASLQEDILGWAVRFPVRPGAGPWTSPGPPPSGYYELGAALVGPVVILGQAYDWGRRQRTESGTALTTARDGTRIAEIERPVRHSISFGYSGGVPTLSHQSKQAPDYLTAYTGGPPVGFRWDVPIDLADIMLETAGAAVPIGYLPSIRQDDTGGSDHHGRGAMIGRCVSESIDVDTVAGKEILDETLRLQAWDFDEET